MHWSDITVTGYSRIRSKIRGRPKSSQNIGSTYILYLNLQFKKLKVTSSKEGHQTFSFPLLPRGGVTYEWKLLTKKKKRTHSDEIRSRSLLFAIGNAARSLSSWWWWRCALCCCWWWLFTIADSLIGERTIGNPGWGFFGKSPASSAESSLTLQFQR